MRVCNLVWSTSRAGGGVYTAVRGLCDGLLSNGVTDLQVLSLKDQFTEADAGTWSAVKPRTFRVVGPRTLGFAVGMKRALMALKPDLIHCHAFWTYPAAVCKGWHGRTRQPYLISPQGLLEPEVELKKSRAMKAVALWAYQMQHLRQASCLHALCDEEVAHIRQFGLRNPICRVPNGVDLPGPDSGRAAPWTGVIEEGKKVLLYLSRINRKKGLRSLIQGLADLRARSGVADDWCLAVVGWDQDGFESELKRYVRELSLDGGVKFLGPLFGQSRDAAFRHADAFVLPSLSEGLPLAILEAWAYGLPVLLTPRCNIPEGPAFGAAICAEPRADDLRDGMRALFEMSDRQRASMGARGLELVKDRFLWTKVGAQMREVYEWLLGGGPSPACVVR